MDTDRFDTLTRALGGRSRRRLLVGLSSSVLSAVAPLFRFAGAAAKGGKGGGGKGGGGKGGGKHKNKKHKNDKKKDHAPDEPTQQCNSMAGEVACYGDCCSTFEGESCTACGCCASGYKCCGRLCCPEGYVCCADGLCEFFKSYCDAYH